MDKTTIATTLDAETWVKISGEEAEKDFLQLVEVYAKWCGPSEAIITTLKRIQLDRPNQKIKFWQVEACEAIADTEKYMTASRPHFLFYKNGEHMDTVEGVNAPQLEKFVETFIPEGVLEADDEVGGEEDDD